MKVMRAVPSVTLYKKWKKEETFKFVLLETLIRMDCEREPSSGREHGI